MLKAHVLSFCKAPLGYLANLVASITYRIPGINHPILRWVDYPICWACETFCISDGIQDDPLF